VTAFLTSPLGLAVLVAAVIAATLFLGGALRFAARLALVALLAGVVLYFIGWAPVVEFVNSAPVHVRRVI
jgi:hypothetical protein